MYLCLNECVCAWTNMLFYNICINASFRKIAGTTYVNWLVCSRKTIFAVCNDMQNVLVNRRVFYSCFRELRVCAFSFSFIVRTANSYKIGWSEECARKGTICYCLYYNSLMMTFLKRVPACCEWRAWAEREVFQCRVCVCCTHELLNAGMC